MNKQTIIFRADGGPTIGMGHFIRTLALAEMLNQHFTCIYATRTPTTYQIEAIEKVCQSWIELPHDDSHFNVFFNQLKGDEIVVLDNYYFNTDYQQTIKNIGCKLVCIDDIPNKHFIADIVINHSEGITTDDYSVEHYTSLLLGYQFALLRKEYLKQNNQIQEKKYSCLVMMGGADPFNITSKLLSYLDDFKINKPIVVITGAGKSVELPNNSYELFNNITAEQVNHLMLSSDFGILPASTVALEACAVRLPFICGYFIDNQTRAYQGIKKLKLAECIGDLSKINKPRFTNALANINSIEIKNNIIKQQEFFIDKQSGNRLMNEFIKLCQ